MEKKIISSVAALALAAFSVFNCAPAEASSLIPLAQAAAQGQQAQGQRQVNAKEAFAMVSAEADKGDAQAMHALATLYEQGVGTARNYTKAVDWYHQAAVKKHPASVYQVGLAYELGKGVTANRDTAIKNFQQAAELKVPEAYYKLASISMAGTGAKSNDKKALEYLKQAGLEGGKALEAIGNFYENGVGLAPNYTTALSWYKKAADAGMVEAMFRVGTCYEIGIGTPVDAKQALASFQRASDNNMAAASYKLAGLYMSGSLIPSNPAKAVEYMNLAARQGHAESANELGVIYLQGMLNEKKDLNKALQMFTRSAELGNSEAMKNIAVMYNNGLGRQADPAAALTWYLIAQKAGYQPESIVGLINEIKGKLTPEQVKNSEGAAANWVQKHLVKSGQAAAK
ncbi:sel1 repeat family protein [Deltaproteobacteria bacterium OttesenSCG-928-K17]|nr:sel1 repeat family protein [Deltaproteobacteria bacterium OttesenSCG-928-K17]